MEVTKAPADFARSSWLLLKQGHKEGALQLAADGVRTYPTYIGGYVILADCFADMGHLDDARLIIAEAERRFPHRRIVHDRKEAYDQMSARAEAVPPKVVEPEPALPRDEPHVELLTKKRPSRQETPVPFERKESPLRVIELGTPTHDDRIIRSSSVRLIPGLEYTSLRFEGSKTRGDRSVNVLPDAPPFRTFHAQSPYRRVVPEPARQPSSDTERRQPQLTLEQLADRIAKVRMTPEHLENKPPAPDPTEERPKQSIVTETLGRIYMQQQQFDHAIETFETLQELIDACIKERDSA
jgi:hypothetical protein